MESRFADWQQWVVIAVVALVVLGIVYRLVGHLQSRNRQKQRIQAARVRSGHAPVEMPTTYGELGPSTTSWANLGADGAKDALVVDEQPTIRIRYTDPFGKLVISTIEVERLDLHRQAIVSRGNSLYDPRIYPLDRIVEARNVRTGKPFNLGAWVEAVRVARRRRDANTDMSSASQWG